MGDFLYGHHKISQQVLRGELFILQIPAMLLRGVWEEVGTFLIIKQGVFLDKNEQYIQRLGLSS